MDIVVLRLPRIANLDEFQPLALERDVRLRFVDTPDEIRTADLIIVPGTKSTLADLAWIRERGLDRAIGEQRARGTPVLGICGGFQMLGERLVDEHGAEARGDVAGLGLLPVTTEFSSEKVTQRVTARVDGVNALWSADDETLDAYEIHMGRTQATAGAHLGPAPFIVSTVEHGAARTVRRSVVATMGWSSAHICTACSRTERSDARSSIDSPLARVGRPARLAAFNRLTTHSMRSPTRCASISISRRSKRWSAFLT